MKMNKNEGVVKRYKAARKWKIFSVVATLLMFAIFLLLPALLWFNGQSFNEAELVIILPVCCVMLMITTYHIISVYIYRIDIFPWGLRQRGVFGSKEVLFSRYKRFRILNNGFAIQFLPVDEFNKKINISMGMERAEAFLSFLDSKLADAEAAAVEAEDQQITQDIDAGRMKAEYPLLLKIAKPWSLLLNITAGLVAAMAVFVASPYELLAGLLTLTPLVAILTVKMFKGLIRFNGVKGSIYPHITYAFMFAPMGLLVRALHDVSPLNYADLIAPCSAAALIFVFLCFGLVKEVREKLSNFIFACIMSVVFGYSATALYNELLDRSKPKTYSSQVVEKNEGSSRSSFYYLTLGPWGPRSEPAKAQVDQTLYESVQAGDTVTVSLMAGRFKAPWFFVEKNE